MVSYMKGGSVVEVDARRNPQNAPTADEKIYSAVRTFQNSNIWVSQSVAVAK